MSNEMKSWIEDRVCEVLFDAGVIDFVEYVNPNKLFNSYVSGRKGEEDVSFEVWCDDEGEWKFKKVDC